MAQALNSNNLEEAKRLNHVANFIHSTFLDPEEGIESYLRAEHAAHLQDQKRSNGELPDDSGNPWMTPDNLPALDESDLEGDQSYAARE